MPTFRKIASQGAPTPDDRRATTDEVFSTAPHANDSVTEQKELPQGWAWTKLENVCHVERGITFPATAKSDQQRDDHIACMRTANVQRLVNWDDLIYIPRSYVKDTVKLLRQHDILISMANSRELVGKVSFVDHIHNESTFGGFIAAIRSFESLDPRFLFYYLRLDQTQEQLRGASNQTVNIANISLNGIYSVSFPLPPLAEQRRIVAAIEQQLTRLDAGVAALREAQARLRRYKAAVLKAACEGRLVPQDPADESADALLRRILDERRAKWEAEQEAKLRAQGRMLLDDGWRAKYVEPQGPDTTGLPELPQGWAWVNTELVASAIDPHPSHRTPPEIKDGVPYIGMGDISDDDKVDFEHARQVAPDVLREHQERYQLKIGDFIFGKIGTLGKPVKLLPPYSYTLSANVVLIQPKVEYINPSFVYYFMASPFMEAYLTKEQRATTQAAFGIQRVRLLPFPLAPLAEQQRIVAEVERRLSVVAEVETAVAANLKRAERLRQAILKRAFAGKLVPQDPSDEPASALLEHIRAERELPAENQVAKRGRKRKDEQLRMEEM